MGYSVTQLTGRSFLAKKSTTARIFYILVIATDAFFKYCLKERMIKVI